MKRIVKKMITLRFSEIANEIIKTRFRAYGASNVSDLGRLALQRITCGPADPLALCTQASSSRISGVRSQIPNCQKKQRAEAPE